MSARATGTIHGAEVSVQGSRCSSRAPAARLTPKDVGCLWFSVVVASGGQGRGRIRAFRIKQDRHGSLGVVWGWWCGARYLYCDLWQAPMHLESLAAMQRKQHRGETLICAGLFIAAGQFKGSLAGSLALSTPLHDGMQRHMGGTSLWPRNANKVPLASHNVPRLSSAAVVASSYRRRHREPRWCNGVISWWEHHVDADACTRKLVPSHAAGSYDLTASYHSFGPDLSAPCLPPISPPEVKATRLWMHRT